VNTPRSDEDMLELMKLTVFLLPSDEKVEVEVTAVDLQVFAVRLMLLMLVQKFLLFGLTNWCCSLSAVRSAMYECQRTSWNEFSSSMASAIICLSLGFSGVETPLFEGMLVEQQVAKEGDADENVENVNAGDAAEGDVSVAHDEIPTVAEEPSIPSPTPLPQPSQDIPSTSQVQATPPQSPQVQPQSPQPQPQPQP
nr:hypothetical protein [Tanacetum cinerariifolium]